MFRLHLGLDEKKKDFTIERVKTWYLGATNNLNFVFKKGPGLNEKQIKKSIVRDFNANGLSGEEIDSFIKDCINNKHKSCLFLKE